MGMPYVVMSYNAAPYLVATDIDMTAVFSNPSTLPTSVPSALAISPDGQMVVASTEDGTLYVYTMTKTGLVFERTVAKAAANVASQYNLAFSPDGKKLLAGHWGNAPSCYVWDTATWTLTTAPSWSALNGDFRSLDWSGDGSLIAISSASPPYVRLFNASDMSAAVGLSVNPTERTDQINFSDDSRYLGLVTWARTSIYRVADRSLMGSVSHPKQSTVSSTVSALNNGARWKPASYDFTIALTSTDSNTQMLAQFRASETTGVTKSLPNVQPGFSGRTVSWRRDGSGLYFGYQGSTTRVYRYSPSLIKDPSDPLTQPTGHIFDMVCAELPDEVQIQTRPVIFLTG